mgnify:CR=1 FL=1
MKNFEDDITDVKLELRSLGDKLAQKEISASEAEKKILELRSKRDAIEAEIKKSNAMQKAPIETRREKTMNKEWADIQTAMTEKRAVTLSGTGAIQQVTDIFKAIAEKDKLLSKVKFYYGASASTAVPVLADMGDFDITQENGNVTVDTEAGLTNISILPSTRAKYLQVSWEALKLGSVNIETEMDDIFGRAYRKLMRKELINGTGTNGQMTGILTGITPVVKPLTMANLTELAISVAGFDEKYSIIMNSPTYAGIMTDNSGNNDPYKYELAQNKTIEGVEVIITSLVPAGKIVAAPLGRYAIAVGAELEIEPIKKVGSTSTYFQAICAFNGRAINPAEVFVYSAA